MPAITNAEKASLYGFLYHLPAMRARIIQDIGVFGKLYQLPFRGKNVLFCHAPHTLRHAGVQRLLSAICLFGDVVFSFVVYQMLGAAARRVRVYSCCGWSNTASALPYSTIRPRCITAIVSAM